jgi:hypothetical protein
VHNVGFNSAENVMPEVNPRLVIHKDLLAATARYVNDEGDAPDEDELRDAQQEFLFDMWQRASAAMDDEDLTDAERWEHISDQVIIINLLQEALALMNE